MEVRDTIHGSIVIEPIELPIINSAYFQRLRQIKQLGFAENSFPSATHNRYIHSLGAMETASQVLQGIFQGSQVAGPSAFPMSGYTRFRPVVRLAALLHDLGHGPLSHTTEMAMPDVKELELPLHVSQGGAEGTHAGGGSKGRSRKATHEDYTLKIILDSGLTPLIEKAGQRFGFKPIHVAALIEPELEVPDDFFTEGGLVSGSSSGAAADGKIDFRPMLKQIISSELDADRMDYLRRDSVNAGVSYGQFDFAWIVKNLTSHIKDGKCYLGLEHRALYAFEDFLISRFHMFLMVYFHYKTVIFDTMLKQYLTSPDCDYSLPADVEKYCRSDDAQLHSHLSSSSNEWAKRIVERRPYQMLVELHSGIPATKTSRLEQERLLAEIEHRLKGQGIPYLVATSTSELSKYFRKPGDPIFVRYDNHYSTPDFIPLEQCSDLFRRYAEKRSITRLYVSPEDYPLCQFDGRRAPLRYE